LLGKISAENTTVALEETDNDVTSVKQMTAEYTPPPLPTYDSKESKNSRNFQIGNNL
jgi:hypothetical protein